MYGIVRQFGGTIDVESIPGEGAAFRIAFPEAAPETPAAAGHPPAARLETQGNERVLLVEDENMIRALLRNTLVRSGYAVVEASNGREALEVALSSDEPIDLLVTDVMMPRMSGVELVERLRTERPAMRVLLMSGYAESTISADGALPRDAALLQKPFSPRVFLEGVRSALDRPVATGNTVSTPS